jgi:hypothetical protein
VPEHFIGEADVTGAHGPAVLAMVVLSPEKVPWQHRTGQARVIKRAAAAAAEGAALHCQLLQKTVCRLTQLRWSPVWFQCTDIRTLRGQAVCTFAGSC